MQAGCRRHRHYEKLCSIPSVRLCVCLAEFDASSSLTTMVWPWTLFHSLTSMVFNRVCRVPVCLPVCVFVCVAAVITGPAPYAVDISAGKLTRTSMCVCVCVCGVHVCVRSCVHACLVGFLLYHAANTSALLSWLRSCA